HPPADRLFRSTRRSYLESVASCCSEDSRRGRARDGAPTSAGHTSRVAKGVSGERQAHGICPAIKPDLARIPTATGHPASAPETGGGAKQPRRPGCQTAGLGRAAAELPELA